MQKVFNTTNSTAQNDDSWVFDDSFIISVGFTGNCG